MSRRTRRDSLQHPLGKGRKPSTPHARRGGRRRSRHRKAGSAHPTADRDTGDELGSASSTESHPKTNRAAACVSILLGAGTAIVLNGLIAGFRTAGASTAISARTVISASFVCLALGVRIPQRCTVWFCGPAWRRFVSRGHASEISVVFLDGVAPDRSLCWAIQSIVALTAGILTAALPFILRGTLAFHAWMQTHFVWSATPLVLLEEATPFVAALLPLTAIGLSISCVHHLSGVLGQWDTSATAWVSIGAALGIAGGALIAQIVHQAEALMVTASLPLLMASVLAAAVGSKVPDSRVPEREPQRKDLPFWSDRWPLLLRASIIAVGAGIACAMIVWMSGVPDSPRAHLMVLPTMFAFLGVGVLLGCRRKSRGLRSIGGFGVACAAAGMITAIGTYGFRSGGFSEFALPLGAACVSVGAMGFATAYGRQTLLHRVASRTAAGATILAGLLVACAAAIWIAAPASIHFLGQPATLMMLGLSLLALGGTLIIHEPTYSRRTRRVRLCAVFASIGALITSVFFFPPIPEGGRISVSDGSTMKQSAGINAPTVQPQCGATDNE